MSIDWCRLWHDMPTDPKFRAVAKRAGRSTAEVIALFTAMLTNASANEEARGTLRNWSHEDMAIAFDMEPEHAEAIYAAMQGKLLDGDKLMGWERRQPQRERDDSSAERTKAWRERQKTQRDASERHVTPCDALDKEEDKDKEKESPPLRASARGEVFFKDGIVKIDDALSADLETEFGRFDRQAVETSAAVQLIRFNAPSPADKLAVIRDHARRNAGGQARASPARRGRMSGVQMEKLLQEVSDEQREPDAEDVLDDVRGRPRWRCC